MRGGITKMTEKPCPVCGGSFQIPSTQPHKKYCCRGCSVIGRRSTKEEAGHKRVDEFIESLPDLCIKDVLNGRLGAGTDNRMTVKGVRTWEDGEYEYIVLVVKK